MTDVKEELEKLRHRLLDLTMRNRMLAYRETKTRTIRIVDERPEELYNILVLSEKKMEFLARESSAADVHEGKGEDEGEVAGEGELLWKLPEPTESAAKHHQDLYLQTPYDPLTLQKRLFYADKKSTEAMEEQGYTVLFLALGYLEWYESDASSNPRIAPLILIPVELNRTSVVKPYNLKWTGEEVQYNISLKEKLANSFAIDLPVFDPETLEDKSGLIAYLDRVAEEAASKPRWKVLNSVYLDFFSFSKFVMYKDLDPAHWPEDRMPWDHEVLSDILAPSGADQGDLFDEKRVDIDLKLDEFYSIMDCDPSQTAVVESAKSGRNLAVEGPPGTGKSQTISNLIAELLAKGKSVLFVSEKMAALDVVKRRLDTAGLGDFCVELHSRKANKRVFLENLEHTLKLAPKLVISRESDHISQLVSVRDELNAYALALQVPYGAAAFSPYDLIGMRENAKSRFAQGSGTSSYVPLANVSSLSKLQFNEALDLLRSIESIAPQVGGIFNNAWAACHVNQIFPGDVDRIRCEIEEARSALGEIVSSSETLSHIAPIPMPETVDHARPFRDAVQLIAECPTGGPDLLRREDSENIPQEQQQCIEALQSWVAAKARMKYAFEEAHHAQDHQDLLNEFRRRSQNLFRFLSPRYYTLKRDLQRLYGGHPGRNRSELVGDLEGLVELQKATRALSEAHELGRSGFGDNWRGGESDMETLAQVQAWSKQLIAQMPHGYISTRWPAELQTAAQRKNFARHAKAFLQHVHRAVSLVQTLMTSLKVDVKTRFGCGANNVTFNDFDQAMSRWQSALDSLQRWSQYNLLRNRVAESAALPVLSAAESGSAAENALSIIFEISYCDTLLREAFAERAALGQFTAPQHENRIHRFRDLDASMMALNKARLHRQLFENRPKINQGANAKSESGILLGQFARKRGHLPIRKLMTLSGSLIQRVKPCFMMSPLSVAQFLDPRTTRFDVVIFDEASQVRPEDAVGAILRGNQLVVAGDTKQLPPTSFFDVMGNPDDDDDDAGMVAASDVESILHQCRRAFPVRYLKWHYRSRHQSLIAVSNASFYDNQLLIYPAPFDDASHLGLSMVHLPDTIYDRGKSACNRLEAKAVAGAVIAHFETAPHLTLGVGTFSVAQQNAVLEEVELLLRERPKFERHWHNDLGENFFVKNLETIQGDERDVILLSVGYGRDSHGKLSANFGPLNKEGGERRLNVLITRARLKCIVYSNFKAEDLRIDENASFGVRSFKAFLKYAETGLLPELEEVGRDLESPFEESVYEFLRSNGYEVAKQIGCASFRIDLAVVDPEFPGRYLIGIECDGATYHSSVVARERDRLRQQVLEGLGWKNRLHRIWSTDWYRDHRGAQERLLKAVDDARKLNYEMPGQGSIATARHTAVTPDLVDTGLEVSTNVHPLIEESPSAIEVETIGSAFVATDGLLDIAREYIECREIGDGAHRYELADAPDTAVVDAICNVVEVESPVHEDEVVRRVRSLWGYARAGAKIQSKVKRAVTHACDDKKILRKGKFLYAIGKATPDVRRREKGKIEYIADEEIDAAIIAILRQQYSTEEKELVTGTARVLGFDRTGKAVETRIAGRVWTQMKEGRLVRKPNGLIDLPAGE